MLEMAWLRLRPAGASLAAFSARARLRPSQASAHLVQSASSRAALTGHTGLVSDIARARRSALAPPRSPTPACARRSARSAPRAARPSPGRRRRPPLRASTSPWRTRGGRQARGTARRLRRKTRLAQPSAGGCSGGFFQRKSVFHASSCPEVFIQPLTPSLGHSGAWAALAGHTGLGFDSGRRPA